MATPNLDNAAANPASASTTAGSVAQHDLAKQIQYDRYAAAKRAQPAAFGGILFGKIIPAAGVPDQQGTNSGTGSGDFDSPGL